MSAVTTVLYAEDDDNDAFFMQRAFAKLHRTDALRIVANGRDVVAYLSGTGRFADRAQFPFPELLILDVKMPEMSGHEVLAWVRAQPAFASLPVVMFTSSTQESDLTFSRTHAANAYLVKPPSAEHLALLIDDLLMAADRLPAPNAPLAVQGNWLVGKTEK